MCHITLHNDHTSSLYSWKHARAQTHTNTHTHAHTYIVTLSTFSLPGNLKRLWKCFIGKEKCRPQVHSVITRIHVNTECCRLHIIHIHTECIMTKDSGMQIVLHYGSLTGLCNTSLYAILQCITRGKTYINAVTYLINSM